MKFPLKVENVEIELLRILVWHVHHACETIMKERPMRGELRRKRDP